MTYRQAHVFTGPQSACVDYDIAAMPFLLVCHISVSVVDLGSLGRSPCAIINIILLFLRLATVPETPNSPSLKE